MYQYRQILVRMRQGDSDRDIARAKTMGRKKVAQLREIARERDWLTLDSPIPDEETLAAALGRKVARERSIWWGDAREYPM